MTVEKGQKSWKKEPEKTPQIADSTQGLCISLTEYRSSALPSELN